MKAKIVRNYNLVEDDAKVIEHATFKKVIKTPNEVEGKLIGLPGETVATDKEAVVVPHTNDDGVVTAIEVQCSCGEVIIIRLEY